MKSTAFLIVMMVYVLAHLYFWKKLKTLFLLSGSRGWALLACLAFLSFAPLLSRGLTKSGWSEVGQYMHWLGAGWLGFFFVFFCLESLVLISVPFEKIIFGENRSSAWRQKPQGLIVIAILAFMVNVYGFLEAGRVTVTHLALSSSAMAPSSPPIRILQISDAHYGQSTLPFRHQNLLEMARRENPDMIVATGDFVDFEGPDRNMDLDQWRAIKPPLGKIAVTGNHEYIAGLPRSLERLEQGGFRVFRNKGEKFNGFSLIGLDDPASSKEKIKSFDRDSFKKQNECVLLLFHRPNWPEELSGLFDLGLSGHTHGGQIFPFGLIVYLSEGVLSGLRSTPWGGWYFVSRGVGSWGPQVRVGAPPEMTMITISPKNNNSTTRSLGAGSETCTLENVAEFR